MISRFHVNLPRVYHFDSLSLATMVCVCAWFNSSAVVESSLGVEGPKCTSMHARRLKPCWGWIFSCNAQLKMDKRTSCAFKPYRLIHRRKDVRWLEKNELKIWPSFRLVSMDFFAGWQLHLNCMASYDNCGSKKEPLGEAKRKTSQNLNLVGCEEWFNRFWGIWPTKFWMSVGEILCHNKD